MSEYTLADYGSMLRDAARVRAFRDSLADVVTKESHVLEVGTGVGYFAAIAARLGAASVTAVEVGDVVHLARSVLEANGCEDKVLLLQGDVRELDSGKRFDVVISDLRGVLPWYRDHLETMRHIREHLLQVDGKLVPQADDVMMSLISDAALYGTWEMPWSESQMDVDLSPVRSFALNCWRVVHLRDENELSPRTRFGRLNHYDADVGDFHGEVEFRIEADVAIHGFSAWTDIQVSEGRSISNAPGREGSTYGQAFFPFETPLAATADDIVRIELDVHRGRWGYDYRWTTRHCDLSGALRKQLEQMTPRGQVSPLVSETPRS